MARKRYSVEQIINHLREAKVLMARGEAVGGVCRRIGVSEQSYDRWRRGYGGLKLD
jgi:transposase-like protein